MNAWLNFGTLSNFGTAEARDFKFCIQKPTMIEYSTMFQDEVLDFDFWRQRRYVL